MRTLMLAHQGGWDEILVVLLPLTIFTGLLAVARHRVGKLERDEQTSEEETSDEA